MRKQLLGLGRDGLAPHGQQLGDAVIAHHGAHGRLGHEAEGLLHVAHSEQVLVRVRNLVLNDPLDRGHVKIPGQHHRLGLGLLVLVERALNVGAGGAKAKLLLELALHRNLLHPFDAKGELGVRAGIAGAHETSEARHQADLVGLYLVVRAVEGHKCDDGQPDEQSRACAIRAAGLLPHVRDERIPLDQNQHPGLPYRLLSEY